MKKIKTLGHSILLYPSYSVYEISFKLVQYWRELGETQTSNHYFIIRISQKSLRPQFFHDSLANCLRDYLPQNTWKYNKLKNKFKGLGISKYDFILFKSIIVSLKFDESINKFGKCCKYNIPIYYIYLFIDSSSFRPQYCQYCSVTGW